jgi:hypothetical protein
LPEDDADTFDVYLHTAYTGHVDVGDLEDAWVGEETLPEYDRRSLRLVNSYVLADKLGDIVTANLIIDELIQRSHVTRRIPTIATSIVAFNTAIESPIRRLYIDFFAREASTKCVSTNLNENMSLGSFPFEVLAEKTRLSWLDSPKALRGVFHSEYTCEHKCRYHHHTQSLPDGANATGTGSRCRQIRPPKQLRTHPTSWDLPPSGGPSN